MRTGNLKTVRARGSILTRVTGSPTRRSASILVVLISGALLAVAVRAYSHVTLKGVAPAKSSTTPRLAQGTTAPRRGRLDSKLSLQPDADRMRRRLGQRFLAAGKERTILIGILTLGTQQYQVAIARTQNDEGEQVQIALNGGPALLTWSATEGAKSGASLANAADRSLIERIALDSPDQFVLAQTRSASYYTLAQRVMPAEVHGSDDYTGPVWDVVRITEPENGAQSRSQSQYRLYYLNSSTGLIEKIYSQEDGAATLAEVSRWVNQDGERVPTHIIWRRTGQVVMELTLTNVSYGSAQ